MDKSQQPRQRIMVLSSLFPNSAEPDAGLFVRERMLRVGKHLPLFVVSPKPWFPLQGLLQKFKPNYRTQPSRDILSEEYQGTTIYFPRFLSLPVIGRRFDGYFMARAVKRLVEQQGLNEQFDHIDAHFSFPDGYAGALLKSRFNKSLTITMRGTEVPHSQQPPKLSRMQHAWNIADKIICVSSSLRDTALEQGGDGTKFTVVGNGIDTEKFTPESPKFIRAELGIAADAKVLVTVGGLVPRKGFHRVINAMPQIIKSHPDLHYLVIGGKTSEGNNEPQLKELARELNIEQRVHFLGKKNSEQLKHYLSAADLFILMSGNEGWANVILEAMACETRVLASNVGGNAEVVANSKLGTIIELEAQQDLVDSVTTMLNDDVDNEALRQYALANSWDNRVERLLKIFESVAK